MPDPGSPAKAGNDAGNEGDALPELTATQYVILAESQRKKRALMETRIKYNALVDENKRLLREREESEKAAFEVGQKSGATSWFMEQETGLSDAFGMVCLILAHSCRSQRPCDATYSRRTSALQNLKPP